MTIANDVGFPLLEVGGCSQLKVVWLVKGKLGRMVAAALGTTGLPIRPFQLYDRGRQKETTI